MEPRSLILIGAFLLALITVETGGMFVLRVTRGPAPFNELQRSFFRAGHAHAAVLLVLSVTIVLATDGTHIASPFDWVARLGVPIAALLMPAGFFLSALGHEPASPNRLIGLLWVGAASLTVGLFAAGVGLIASGAGAL